MWGSKGIATIWTWRVVGAELKDFYETVSSKHGGEKAPVLIRPLVQKLPIDFHRGWSWADDQPKFSASTKAKLSHLEAGSAFRDQHSPLTPAANLFPSGGAFFFFLGGKQLQNFNTMVPLLMVLPCNFLLPSVSTQFGSQTFCFSLDDCSQTATSPRVYLLLFVQINRPNIKKIAQAYKTCVKKLALHQCHKQENLLCGFISFFALKPFSEVWVCLNWSV